MNWKLKCLSSHILVKLPKSDFIYDFIQKRTPGRWQRDVFATLATSNNYIEHLEAFKTHYGNIHNATYFEFGVARDLFSVLLNYCYGIPRQLAIDLRPLARKNLVNHAIRQLRTVRHPGFVRTTEREVGSDVAADLMSFYGIEYRAPSDARAVKMPDGSTDIIATTNTFEHIPPNEIKEILTECHRLCHQRSVIRMDIDYSDHYSHRDKDITPYNFLQFSEKEWKYLDMQHYYTNRLRHSDYRTLFEQTGFRIIDEFSETPPDAIERIASIKLAVQYKDYQLADLVKTRGVFVAVKK